MLSCLGDGGDRHAVVAVRSGEDGVGLRHIGPQCYTTEPFCGFYTQLYKENEHGLCYGAKSGNTKNFRESTAHSAEFHGGVRLSQIHAPFTVSAHSAKLTTGTQRERIRLVIAEERSA